MEGARGLEADLPGHHSFSPRRNRLGQIPALAALEARELWKKTRRVVLEGNPLHLRDQLKPELDALSGEAREA